MHRAAALAAALALFAAGGAMAKKKKKPAAATEAAGAKSAAADKGKPVAVAEIAAKSGSKLSGKATFSEDGKGGLVLKVEVENAPPGEHAVHIHDKGDCSSADGKSAGEHWNPTHMQHGKWGAPGEHYHLGDIGNLTVAADGKGTLMLETNKWSANEGAANDVIGHAIVVHGGVDDFRSQPAGNAGPRIGCGVITAEGKK